MDLTNVLVFAAISFVLVISPGPNILYVVTAGLTRGRKAALAAVLGASAGDLVQVGAACLGLAALLKASAIAFFTVKVLGTVYLLYIGVRCLLDKGQIFAANAAGPETRRELLVGGFLTSALNLKTTLFFFSFLPQFVDAASGDAGRQLLMLGLLFAAMGLAVMIVYAAAAGGVRKWVMADEKAQTLIRWLSGLIFIGFGARLALAGRN